MGHFHKRVTMVHNKHKEMELLVKWVPGPMDIVGNDQADTEAKKAVTNGSSPVCKLPAPLRKTLPGSKLAVHQAYHHKLKWAASKVWFKSRFERMALIDPELVNDVGNPRVRQAVPVPVPAHTLTRKPRVFPNKTSPRTSKTDEKWLRYT